MYAPRPRVRPDQRTSLPLSARVPAGRPRTPLPTSRILGIPRPGRRS